MTIMTMQEALHQLMGTDFTNCSGTTHKDGYMAYYHERGLYSVEQKDAGVIMLVYARSPYEAIAIVDEYRFMRAEEE